MLAFGFLKRLYKPSVPPKDTNDDKSEGSDNADSR